MVLTEQQALVLFDIAKRAMNIDGGFGGYSNETIMRLINDIISQQSNTKFVDIYKDDKKYNKEEKENDFWK